MAGKPLYKSLNSLRGVFALMVFLHHTNTFEAGGDAAVSFFIMLSGFVLSAVYMQRAISGELHYKVFFLKRVTTIYPYHIIGFLAALALMPDFWNERSALSTVLNLSLLQSWVPVRSVYFSYDPPSWCLSVLLFCYAMFPMLARSTGRARPGTLLLVTVFLIAVYVFIANLVPEAKVIDILYVNPALRLLDFFFGIVLWRVFSSCKGKTAISRMSGAPSSYELLSAIIFISAVVAFKYIPERYQQAMEWWLPMSLLIFTFAATNAGRGMLSRALERRPLQWFGTISFAFYVIHAPILFFYWRILHHMGKPFFCDLSAPDIIIVFIASTIAAAIIQRLMSRLRLSRLLPF